MINNINVYAGESLYTMYGAYIKTKLKRHIVPNSFQITLENDGFSLCYKITANVNTSLKGLYD